MTTSNKQLGLRVPPGSIRLRPRHDDPYRWNVAKSVDSLFNSDLSRGSIGVFQKICDALNSGNLIEAVSPKNLQQEDPWREDEHHDLGSDDSFTATIQRLEREVHEAIADNKNLREKQEQEIFNIQREREREREGLQREILQWKHVAESQDRKFQEMKDKVTPALDMLNLHLSELFDKREP
ncbi:uncharacterized protein BDW43DRAFT_304272 [Aspergillus alliaceus]|uniref:uncharacterized protein n=1 Tax=Petromyces alliaceus TaxID=209559 RepID=UPI0012A559AA|nr:uncharacterized protein BDW43DRAFT_304272 [Aspergillus alliaceus]KAB8227877.1 hypothetical protein BDW43DRAFT_304272 [Aspergillus alliaceus]